MTAMTIISTTTMTMAATVKESILLTNLFWRLSAFERGGLAHVAGRSSGHRTACRLGYCINELSPVDNPGQSFDSFRERCAKPSWRSSLRPVRFLGSTGPGASPTAAAAYVRAEPPHLRQQFARGERLAERISDFGRHASAILMFWERAQDLHRRIELGDSGSSRPALVRGLLDIADDEIRPECASRRSPAATSVTAQ